MAVTNETRSAYSGLHCTHVRQREDAVTHNGRDFVPTIWGKPDGNTVWVHSWEELYRVGGAVMFNEDQTEIHLVLPAGHKFGIGFEDISRRGAVDKANSWRDRSEIAKGGAS